MNIPSLTQRAFNWGRPKRPFRWINPPRRSRKEREGEDRPALKRSTAMADQGGLAGVRQSCAGLHAIWTFGSYLTGFSHSHTPNQPTSVVPALRSPLARKCDLPRAFECRLRISIAAPDIYRLRRTHWVRAVAIEIPALFQDSAANTRFTGSYGALTELE